MKKFETTLNEILKHNPCGQIKGSNVGFDKLLSSLGKTKPDDETISLKTILESNGLEDTIWVFRAIKGCDREFRLFAAACAKEVLPVFEKEYPDDKRPRNSIETAIRYANGNATKEERAAAWDAAWATAWDAAWDAAWAAVRAAVRAAAGAAARAAAGDAAGAAARRKQEKILICMINMRGIFSVAE